MSYLEDWIYTIKNAFAWLRDWADDSPVHLLIIAVVLLSLPYWWKWLLIYLIAPGSFVATYAVIAFIKKYIAS